MINDKEEKEEPSYLSKISRSEKTLAQEVCKDYFEVLTRPIPKCFTKNCTDDCLAGIDCSVKLYEKQRNGFFINENYYNMWFKIAEWEYWYKKLQEIYNIASTLEEAKKFLKLEIKFCNAVSKKKRGK